MKLTPTAAIAALALSLALPAATRAGQPPRAATDPDRPISHRDRIYAAEQFSNTVSVTDPASNEVLGMIRLGEPTPANFSPLYKGQLLVHGLGFSPDGRTLAVVSIGSNSVSFIDTQTNAVRHVTYLGRSPHEAFYTPDGKELWVTVRGEDYVAVIDAATYREKTRIPVPAGPGMQIFSPDGKYGYVCSSFQPRTSVVSVAEHKVIATIEQASAFCPNIAATPDGKQVWFTLKDIGKVQVFDARPPFASIRTIDTGPITNHVNFVRNRNGQFAYVTVGGTNEVKVFRTDDFSQVATIPVGKLPHGLWPSGDGSRIYVGLENEDALAAIDTLSQRVVATIPVGQAPQAVVYVPDAVRQGDGRQNLQPAGTIARATQLSLVPVAAGGSEQSQQAQQAQPAQHAEQAPTSVALFDQGLVQVLQASATGLQPKQAYVLGLADRADGGGRIDPLARFMANPAGSAIVNTVGPIRQVVAGGGERQDARRYLVIAPVTDAGIGAPVQRQVP